MDEADTIVAIATPPGVGGIAVIRLSGPQAIALAQRVFVQSNGSAVSHFVSHRVQYGFVVDAQGLRVDEVMLCVMCQPRSYTREDVAEISCHGGPLASQRVLDVVLAQGARVAEPGEFTKRAFLNGRLDLAQAEAVIDVINARTVASQHAALSQLAGALSQRLREFREELLQVSVYLEAGIDFPEEDLDLVPVSELRARLETLAFRLTQLLETFRRGRVVREGLVVAIVGRPNVGKSSLLNALLGRDRAIVSPHPGTTRDTIEDALDIQGVLVRIIDTAGMRTATDAIEQEGVRRAREAVQQAELLIVVLDGTTALTAEDVLVLTDTAHKPRLLVRNKCDLPAQWSLQDLAPLVPETILLDVSALQEQGLQALEGAIVQQALGHEPLAQDEVFLTRVRHRQGIATALQNVRAAEQGLQQGIPLEFVAFEVTEAMEHIADVLGEKCSEEVLDRIFSSFCIGK